ncbi:hypothetical protein KIN20_037341 [Parelaphostrongylus tenuis]|uniref:Uncharacterized protein n=1 Tax=Parelaphostrongylus tenuis TaxID=148309 RepID=A0AAD5WL84_PARTN|nr:hypothetical protein KIN20_037341 [Parelaphostrongylus tenuis]
MAGPQSYYYDINSKLTRWSPRWETIQFNLLTFAPRILYELCLRPVNAWPDLSFRSAKFLEHRLCFNRDAIFKWL